MLNDKRHDIQKLTCKQLRIHCGTGRALHISGTGRDRKYTYRVGCMTDIGDVPMAEWNALARYIIERGGEQDLYEGLAEYAKSCAWLHSKNEREEYALKLQFQESLMIRNVLDTKSSIVLIALEFYREMRKEWKICECI